MRLFLIPSLFIIWFYSRSKKNMTLSIELRNMDNTQTGTNSVGDVANVKVKEIVIVSLILSVWFYSLYR